MVSRKAFNYMLYMLNLNVTVKAVQTLFSQREKEIYIYIHDVLNDCSLAFAFTTRDALLTYLVNFMIKAWMLKRSITSRTHACLLR